MTPTRYQQVQRAFLAAHRLPSADQVAFVRCELRSDRELAREVEQLLAAAQSGASFLDRPIDSETLAAGLLAAIHRDSPTNLLDHTMQPGGVSEAETLDDNRTTDPVDAVARIGTQIGPYRLLRIIGEGGMGSVYEAEQRSPIARKVALKVIKLGMDTREVVARFESERQALAMMDHANIARVFDAGATETGRPYFVMELVKGEPITKYCDVVQTPLRERLVLFVDVCHAVQHAHQKGIIHRDLKPSNVLVALADGKPVPKVIDFGIAKATSGRLTDSTVVTGFRQVLGTPAYMSPEQAELTSMDIDTRSDVYALGVLLYELLTGHLPFDPARLRSASLFEFQRIIREEEPPTPSSRISTLGAAAKDVAARRQIDPQRLRRTLLGDLDWIVMKCLEKDRQRRYETANGLAADIQRYMNGEPVVAAPPSAAYRLRKLVGRNRGAVTAMSLVAAALVLGFIGTSIGFARAVAAQAAEVEQRQRADREAAEAKKQAQAAIDRADETQQVADFQAEQLSDIDARKMGAEMRAKLLEEARLAMERSALDDDEVESRTAQLDELLAGVNLTNIALDQLDRNIFTRALAAAHEKFEDQPLVQAQLLQTLADTLLALGLLDRAAAPQEEALGIRRRMLGDEHPSTLTSINNMGALLQAQGKPDQAEPYYLEALNQRRRVLGEEHPSTLSSINNMGYVLQARGKLAEAESYFREALEKCRRVLGDENRHTLTSINNMGYVLQVRGKLTEAEPYYREALDAYRRVLGEEHPETLPCLNNMANLLQAQGKLADAEPYHREVLEKRRRVLGDEHPETLHSISNMGFLLQAQGRRAEAEPFFREALEKSARVLGDEHPDTLTFINNMAGLLQDQGRPAEAELYYRQLLEKRRRILGDENAATLTSINDMGALLQSQGKLAEAESYYREALEKYRRVLGDEHPHTLASLGNLGAVLYAQGRLAEAEPYFLEALETRRRTLGDEHPTTLTSINNMGMLLYSEGKLAEAEVYVREALAARRRVLGDEHPNTLSSINNLGHVLQTQGKLAEAEPYVREALEKYRRVFGAEHAETLAPINNMGMLLKSQGKLDEAEPYYREALEKCRRILGDEHPNTLRSINNMGLLLSDQHKLNEAEPLVLEVLEKSRRVLGAEHPSTCVAISSMGSLLQAQGKLVDAEPYCRDAVEKSRRILGEAHPNTLNYVSNLGGLLQAQGKLAEAEELLQPAVEIVTAKLPERHSLRGALIRNMMKVCEARHAAEPGQGYDAKADEWRAKLAEWQASTQPASLVPAGEP
ncbi:MAG: tetratricopeptide repeat protein [Phycisphaerales bacterium]|nr:tetratricopeptide repeat protein [Phycisphaerales bacterium]